MENKLKIALLKQEVYPDLYVCPVTEKDPATILYSSMRGVGPIGLITDLEGDFYIIKEEPEWETQIYRRVIPKIAKYLPMLKTQTVDKLPGQAFKQPGSPYPNGKFAVDGRSIDWSQYDIVVSVNVALPTQLIRQYPKTLFAYMIGEANMATKRPHFGYDVTLNQLARGIVATRCGQVDFPYTFMGSHTLEDILAHHLQRPSKREGIFMEINSTTERPVTRVPDHFKPLEQTGQPVILHHQKIGDNLQAVYDAKYFIKWGGRGIRGNSVVEAISLGALCLMNRDDIIYKELIIDECNVKSMDELLNLVNRLEQDPALYEELRAKQRAVVQDLFFSKPLLSLENCLKDKRARKNPPRYSFWNKMCDRFLAFPIERPWK